MRNMVVENTQRKNYSLKIKQMEELKFGKQQTIGNYMSDFVCFLPSRQEKGKLLAGNEKDLFFITKQ